MLGESRFIEKIRLRNLLSFGPEAEEIELCSLNVLIGPNGSGKSNFIEAIGLLRAAPGNLLDAIRQGGGIGEWIWKGATEGQRLASLDTTVRYGQEGHSLRHCLSFAMVNQRLELDDESIAEMEPSTLFSLPLEPEHCYRYNHGEPYFEPTGKLPLRALREPLKANQSVLSQRKDPERFPQITYLGNQYSSVRLYRNWSLGREAPAREAQKTDLPVDFLEESCRNLGLVLNDFQQRPSLWDRVWEELKRFYEPIEDVTLKIYGGTVQVLVHEAGLKEPIPATRLSDGTLRYLCLLSILLHPSPPPLICIEEPELGLHPDILPPLADLLVEASHRTQLIVTTHSETLVDALTSTPEAVVVCEKMSGSTVMQRLDSASLAKWLDEYTLGRLWRSGEIGGNRW